MGARRGERLTALASELGGAERALAIPTDLTGPGRARALVDAAATHFGRLDGLVNNAGLFAGGRLAAVELEHLRKCWELNILALLEATQAAVPYLRRTRGLIVNVSSPSAFLGLPRLAPYAMTKAAVSALSESLRRELLPDGIRVLVAYPGLTESELGATALGEVSPYARRRWRPRARPAAPVAAEIVEAIRRDRREVWTTTPSEHLGATAYGVVRRLAPSLLDRVIARLA